jgi:hypothetical protein
VTGLSSFFTRNRCARISTKLGSKQVFSDYQEELMICSTTCKTNKRFTAKWSAVPQIIEEIFHTPTKQRIRVDKFGICGNSEKQKTGSYRNEPSFFIKPFTILFAASARRMVVWSVYSSHRPPQFPCQARDAYIIISQLFFLNTMLWHPFQLDWWLG